MAFIIINTNSCCNCAHQAFLLCLAQLLTELIKMATEPFLFLLIEAGTYTTPEQKKGRQMWYRVIKSPRHESHEK